MNGIEKEIGDRAEVIRVNLFADLGKQLAERFQVNSAGTNLLLDANGNEVYRHVGAPQRKKIVELIGKS